MRWWINKKQELLLPPTLLLCKDSAILDFASFPHSFTFAMFARLFALALYVNWARFTDEKVSRRFHSPGWATNISTCQYLVVRDRIVLNKAKVKYHLSWSLAFWFCCLFSSWELWSTNINTMQYLQSALYQVILIPLDSKNSKNSAFSSAYEPSEIILTARWSALCWRCIALEMYCTGDVLHWVSVSEP